MFSWKVQTDGSIRVQARTTPLEVNLWQATNPKARDFRLLSIGQAYKKSPLPSEGDGVYVAKVEKPSTGWRSEEHTSELQSHSDLVCRLLLEKKKKIREKAKKSDDH